MSIVTDLTTYLEEIKVPSEELNSYFRNAGFDWLGAGRPDQNKPLPAATIDTWYEVTAPTKSKAMLSTYTIYLSFWYQNTLDESVRADEMSKLLCDTIHQVRTASGLMIQVTSRQPTSDPDSGKARIRIQLKVTRV